jgi:pimeloyl-ACP methyl ester carboxylesterase
MEMASTGRQRRLEVADGVELAAFLWGPQGGEGGRGAPFVLMHGIASNARTWDPVARVLAEAGRTVAALDFRGHGRSASPAGGYDVATFTADLQAAVGALGFRRPILAGHSLGACVALESATRTPELCRGVALLEGALVDASVQFDSLEECLARQTLPPVDGMPRPRVEGYLRATNPGWSEERLAGTMASFRDRPDATIEWCLARPGFESLLRSLWAQHAAELWPWVTVPCLVVAADTGDERWTGQKRAAAAAAEQAMPGARLAWLAGDHDIHADRPSEVASLLLDEAPKMGD